MDEEQRDESRRFSKKHNIKNGWTDFMENDSEEQNIKTDIIVIIKKMLEKHNIKGIDIKGHENCLELDNSTNLIYFCHCPFSEYFRDKICPTDLHSVYSFKCPNHVIEMLKNNDLRFTNLIPLG